MLRQKVPPQEIIVVDDGSTDETCAEVARFGTRVTLLRQQNLGPGAARNKGLSRANGTFVQFFDSDDLATLDVLDAKLKAIRATSADLAYGSWLPVRIEGNRCLHDGVVRQTAAVGDRPLSALLRGWVLFLPNCLIRRETILRFGGYPTEVMTAEDLLLLFNLLAGGVRMVFTPESLLLVRQHPHGQISASPEGAAARARDYLRFATAVRDRLNQESLPVTWLDRLWWRATCIESAERLAAFDVAADATKNRSIVQTSILERRLFFAVSRLRQLKAGLRARATGSRLSSFFRTGPIIANHEGGIRGLGYVPVYTRDMDAIADGSEIL
jgi:cellulose synthase/poly-beta-1,6-N-acetylglucosamine synthase-like glycosyltransferase